jgi:hypothetical protein
MPAYRSSAEAETRGVTRDPKVKLISLVVPFELYTALKDIAGEEPVEDVCERMLNDIVEDDRLAHSEAA